MYLNDSKKMEKALIFMKEKPRDMIKPVVLLDE